MPICERDPWRFQYFEAVQCPPGIRIPTDDIDCWEWYPQWRWLYDKVNIARSQGLACGTHAESPPHFPVFSKPAVNLKGMGIGSRVIASAAEFEAARQPGHMWMTLLEGEHISTDCAIVGGKARWMRHAMGVQGPGGTFRHWIVERNLRAGLATFLEAWISRHMHGYTGMFNFETIGGFIIEAHLRFSDQWCDLYGAGWIEALVRLYSEGVWSYADSERREAYSIPLFASHGRVPKHPPQDKQSYIRAMPDVASLQITYYESRTGAEHPMPPGGFRLGIINSWNLRSGLDARNALAACFPDCDFILPE